MAARPPMARPGRPRAMAPAATAPVATIVRGVVMARAIAGPRIRGGSRRMRPAMSVQFGSMSGRDELLALLRARSLMEGDFVLSSGEPSDWYIEAQPTTPTGKG